MSTQDMSSRPNPPASFPSENARHEHRHREIIGRVYATFLREAAGLPENEWRVAAVECAMGLMKGMEASLRTEMTARAMGFVRCAHCAVLLEPAEIASHICDPELLRRFA
jgi:hypothetical protein